jgi:hypothetical protein
MSGHKTDLKLGQFTLAYFNHFSNICIQFLSQIITLTPYQEGNLALSSSVTYGATSPKGGQNFTTPTHPRANARDFFITT